MFRGGLVRMPVVVQPRTVFVNMGMLSRDVRVRRRKFLAEPLADARKIQQAEQDQHQSNGKFHRQPYARRNNQIEQNDACAHQNNRDRVAQPPERS